MGLSLNKIVKPQSIALNKKATLFSNDRSPSKRLYVEGMTPRFTRQDVLLLLKNLRSIYRLPFTLYKTTKLIRHGKRPLRSVLDRQTFEAFSRLMQDLEVADWGVFEVTPEKVFKDCGVPYTNAIVLSVKMDPTKFTTAPSMECQLEVAKIYTKSGDAANILSSFLQKNGYGATPNHSMGGQVDYSMAAQWANMAVVGRHSMAITRKSGACHRISLVYTNITNFSEFIPQEEDLSWISDFCGKCGKCIRNCPKNAIYPEPLKNGNLPLTRIDYERCCEGFRDYGCGVCIKVCPFTTMDYETLKNAYFRNRKVEEQYEK